jgi:tRNA-(ms[2]io[6]A)-hydroxylase
VVKIMHQRGLKLLPDEKDPYVNALRKHMRDGTSQYLMDRLLIAGIIEARGAERFGLVAEALPEGDLKRFYQSIARSEEAHQSLFTDLAKKYFNQTDLAARLDELLTAEADIMSEQPFRAALH